MSEEIPVGQLISIIVSVLAATLLPTRYQYGDR